MRTVEVFIPLAAATVMIVGALEIAEKARPWAMASYEGSFDLQGDAGRLLSSATLAKGPRRDDRPTITLTAATDAGEKLSAELSPKAAYLLHRHATGETAR